MLFFLACGSRARNDAVIARIERRGDALDGAALARGIPALEHDHHRDAPVVELHLQGAELVLFLLELLDVGLLVDREGM